MTGDRLTDGRTADAGFGSRPAISTATVGDYIELFKPRVMSLVIFTALVGMVVSNGHVNPVIGFAALVAIAIGAGASGALNMWWDADIDAKMSRTQGRPIPAGRVAPDEALALGLSLSIGSVAFLGLITNLFAAAFLAFTIFFYAVIYSMWLKRATAQNIVIGGAAGAFPPMVAEAAVTGGVSAQTAVLFLIIFLWTPPHFWALALNKSDDYGRAGIPMLPNVAGPDATRRQILIYTLLLVPCGLLPFALGVGGVAYAVVAAVSGAAMLAFAIQVFVRRTGEAATRAAQHLFGFSILYLLLLFATLLAERTLGLGGQGAALADMLGGVLPLRVL
ncbi:heme o synthase [Chelatococcus reniformis]|nr:heme o synthase [Chelatococcus reniformis]